MHRYVTRLFVGNNDSEDYYFKGPFIEKKKLNIFRGGGMILPLTLSGALWGEHILLRCFCMSFYNGKFLFPSTKFEHTIATADIAYTHPSTANNSLNLRKLPLNPFHK